jgi:hypothetical protein
VPALRTCLRLSLKMSVWEESVLVVVVVVVLEFGFAANSFVGRYGGLWPGGWWCKNGRAENKMRQLKQQEHE